MALLCETQLNDCVSLVTSDIAGRTPVPVVLVDT
jgi:hypothetical protein